MPSKATGLKIAGNCCFLILDEVVVRLKTVCWVCLLRKAVEGGEESVKRALMNTIAGEVVFSKRPGDVLRKWRLLFEQSQKNLAKAMGVASSVLSDYENSRRKSPGTDFIRRYVTALIELDVARGGHHLRRFSGAVKDLSSVVLGDGGVRQAEDDG
jgi:hypothetical protein